MNSPSTPALQATTQDHRPRWALHPAQRAVWLDLHMAAQPLAYQLTGSCWIDGPLADTMLQQSLTLLAARHDALRLRVDGQRPEQWLHAAPLAPLGLHTARSDEHALTQRAQLLTQVLALGDAPLFGFDLIRVSPTRALLAWRFHHLIADGMSLDLVLQRWLQTCQVLSEETPQELPAGSAYTEHLPVPADGPTAADEPAMQKHLQYWRERLAQRDGAPLFSPPSSPAADAQHQVWRLEGAAYQRFVAACRAQKLSTQQALQGLYTIALASRYDRWDVTVGLALHGREFAHKQVIGMFSKALPVRVQLDPLSTLKRSVTRVAEQMSADFRHQAVPTDMIARAVAQGHEPKPLYEAALTLRQVPASPQVLRIGSLSIQTLPTPHVEIGALGWHVMEHLGSHFSFALCHRPDLLDSAEPEALAAHLRHLMEVFSAPGNTWLFEQAAVTAPEHAALLQAPSLPPTQRLEDLVAQRCAAQAEALALIEGEQRWRYGELQRHSNQRAQRLRAWLDQHAQAGPEPVVALCLARSADTVMWMLAILQAQAVILPIDPHLPVARQHFMVRDAAAVLSIGLGESPTDWPGPWWDSAAATQAPASALPLAVTPASPLQLAYLIYTSGSTGQPKPVAVPHTAVCNLVHARAHYYAVDPGDRVLATNAVGFDVSISQLLMPLAQGACIVMAPPLRGLTPAQFWRLASEQEITHLNATPSVMEAMLDHPALSAPRSLIVGGEALTRSLARRLIQALPQTRILNVYGPTETCIDATQWALNDHLPALQGSATRQAMPIGRGLLNYQVMVLDSQWRLAAPGVVGEIFIGGAGLARGYLGQPSLTAERFLPNPFGPPGSRMYRTGDRGRWRADGEIEFLGRRDDQVKVRGYRIQTGEIAAVLGALPGISQAVVLARPVVANGEPALVAYWQGQGWTPDRLREALAQHLPEYMLPMAYVAVAALPLTVNQKLDWRALPEPGLEHLVQAQAHEPPEGERELELAALWQALLGVPHIGRHDSFFALGGHSLGLVRLAEQLRQRGWAVDMAALFGRPTIAALAQQLAPLPVETPSAVLLPLDQAPWESLVAQAPGGAANVEALLPLTAMQHGLLFHHVLHPQDDGYQEIIHLRFASRRDALQMVEALQHLVSRHQALRAAMRWEGLPQPVQMVLREVTLPVRRWDPATPDIPRLDLRQAPLMAVALQDTELDQACELVLSCHHLIMDHESMALLVRETVAHHQGLPLPEAGRLADGMARQQPPHPDITKAYFAQALQGLARGTVPYGLTNLERASEGRRWRQPLNASLSATLRQRAQAHGVSPAAIFHLAWLRCLAHVCGQSDVTTGTVLLGRSQATAAHTMGMFINTLPLRLALGNLTPAAALQAVHQALAGLMAHEQAPLSQALAAAGLPPQEPLFTSLLNYRHSDHKAVNLATHWPGLEVLAVSESATFVIDVAVDDEGEGFTLSLELDGRLDPAPLATLLQEALTLLSQHLDEDRPLMSWPLRSALLAQPDEPPPEAPAALHGATLFKAAAQRHPDALAVCDERRQMRYGEVAQEVHRRARALLQTHAALKAPPNPVVGLALERSIEVVLWLLALHEAGMTALPLDVSHPRERLNAMLQDSRALFVISDQATRDWRVPVWHEMQPHFAEPSPARHAPNDVAYIIYTSGSTGQPKGVAVPHTALAHLSASRQANDPLHPGDVVLATSSIGFDIAMGQLLLPLYRGATVVVSPPLRELDATQLSELLRQHRVTHVDGVPSFYEVLLQGPAPSHLVSATLGGERITPQLVRRLRAAWPGVRLLNVYGPTETTIDGTAWVLPPQQELPSEAPQVPIGQAMPFYKAYVLDAHWQPVPPGAPGELWLGGACVAQGYVGQPALTAERFVPDPWGPPGSRMYRTGDRVSVQNDGQLVFLGRQDAQVKLRGHRIELAEIEQRLLSHPAVRRVVTRVQNLGAHGQAHLVAYLEGEACPSTVLRQHCLATLPSYMCPSAWVWLDALPCTPNGKVDLAALPAPDLSSQRDLKRALTAPRDATEAALLGLWQQVLEQADISVDDDFFALGGNSLALLRLHASMSDHLGQTLPLRLLFEHATIASQAEALRTAAARPQGGSGLLSLRPALAGNTQAPLFAIYPYGGTSFCYAELARLLPPGRAVWGLQAQGLEPGEVPLRQLSEMATLALRQVRRVQADGPLHLMGYSMGGLIAVEMAAQAEAAGERVALLALLDSPLPGLPNDPQGTEGPTEVLADVVQGLLPHLPPAARPATLDELQAQLAASLPTGTALSRDDVQRLIDVASGMLAAARHAQGLSRPGHVQTWLQVCADDGQQPPVDWQPWLQQTVPTLTLKTRHEALMTGPTARALADWLAPWIQAHDGEPHA